MWYTIFQTTRGIVHNYLRKHLTLGITPAFFAGDNQKISWYNLAGFFKKIAQIS
jgi:hypothetical protein